MRGAAVLQCAHHRFAVALEERGRLEQRGAGEVGLGDEPPRRVERPVVVGALGRGGDRAAPVGELLTAASVSPGVSLAEVAISLTIFTLLYGGLAVAEAVLLTRHVRKGPEQTEPAPATERLQPSLMY